MEDLNFHKMDFDRNHLKKINSSWLKHFIYANYFNCIALLVFITSIYALIAFGSGIKQVYLLRNIEVVLVVIALIFGGSILGSA